MKTLRTMAALGYTGLMALTQAGCGPHLPFDIAMRESATNVQYGNQKAVRLAPPPAPPAANLSPDFPGFITMPAPPPQFRIPTTPVGGPGQVSPTSCPTPGLADAPKRAVTTGVAAPPSQGDYLFRQSGSIDKPPKPLPAALAVHVGNVHQVSATQPSLQKSANPTAKVWSFDVVQSDSLATTTTTYWIDPGTSASGASLPLNANPDGGLKIAQVVTNYASGNAPDTFSPSEPVRIFNLPAVEELGATGDSGVDPVSGTYMSVSHQTKKQERINACGQWLQAWQVLVQVGLSNPKDSMSLNLTGTFDVVTQYGGLIVANDLQQDGTASGGGPFTEHQTDTINQVPAEPAMP